MKGFEAAGQTRNSNLSVAESRSSSRNVKTPDRPLIVAVPCNVAVGHVTTSQLNPVLCRRISSVSWETVCVVLRRVLRIRR